jgi:hypothetical protein
MRNLILVMSFLLLGACGSSEQSRTGEKSNGGVIPQHQLDALSKAENVSSMLQQAEQERRDQTDQ